MKKIAIVLLLALIAPSHSWSMQHKKDPKKLPTKSRLQAAKNRKNQLLLQAAQDGNLEQVKTLAEQAELNFHEPETDASPLLVACEKGRINIVKFLVKKLTTQEINERRGRDGVSVTPVWLAAQKKRTASVRTLVAAGADVSIPDQEGYLPLHLAADGTDLNLLCCLLQADPSVVNAQNIHGVTPLQKACYHNNIDAAALLLTYGANPKLQENNGYTAFDYATSKKLRELLTHHASEHDDVPPRYEQHAQPEDPAITRVAWVCMPPAQNSSAQDKQDHEQEE
jgi:ankyrin repeat protein